MVGVRTEGSMFFSGLLKSLDVETCGEVVSVASGAARVRRSHGNIVFFSFAGNKEGERSLQGMFE